MSSSGGRKSPDTGKNVASRAGCVSAIFVAIGSFIAGLFEHMVHEGEGRQHVSTRHRWRPGTRSEMPGRAG